MSWRSEEHLPVADGEWACWRPPWGRRRSGETAVRAALRRWHPWDPLLVGYPGSTRLLPPVCVPELTRDVQTRALFQYRLLMAVLVVWTLGFGIAAYSIGAQAFRNAAVAGVLMFAYALTLYTLVFQPVDVLRENSRFVAWIYLSPLGTTLAVLGTMILLGVLQYWLQRRAGGLEPLITQYGLVFDSAGRQPWRYITGPFIHSGLDHWLPNATLLVTITAIATALGKRTTVATVFATGTILPAVILTFLPYAIRQDALLGISGGVLALFGWAAGVGWRERKWLPQHFALIIGMFSLLFLALASLLSQRANGFVHASGLLIGLVLGLLGLGWKRSIEEQETA